MVLESFFLLRVEPLKEAAPQALELAVLFGLEVLTLLLFCWDMIFDFLFGLEVLTLLLFRNCDLGVLTLLLFCNCDILRF